MKKMYEDAKYFTTKEKLQETINTYGVAIIPSLIDEKECEKMLSGMWDYFETITKEWETPIDRKNGKLYY